MSLVYVLDGYNIINHPAFASCLNKNKDQREALAGLIRKDRLCGSAKNKVVIVFDGYPAYSEYRDARVNPQMLFSKDESADKLIKDITETADNPKIMVVVSDDREVKFFAKASGARALCVEEFLRVEKQAARQPKAKDASKDELSYIQVDKINNELKTLWLK